MNKDAEQNTFDYILPYKKGEEMRATLKDGLFQAREHILAANPNLQEEYEKRAASSKYSVDSVTLSAVFPSFVRYLSIGWKKPKMHNKIPKIIEKHPDESYKEYVFDSDNNLLMIKTVYQETIRDILYAVNFNGYQYIFNIDNFFEVGKLDTNEILENLSIINAYCYVGRIKYENDKLIEFEEYSSSYFSVKDYYSEIYYTVDGKEYCTSQEGMFKGDDKLPATDKQSSISTHIYQLSFNNSQIAQIDEILLPDGQIETIFPKKPNTLSGLPRTKGATKVFKQMLKENGCTTKNKIAFA